MYVPTHVNYTYCVYIYFFYPFCFYYIIRAAGRGFCLRPTRFLFVCFPFYSFARDPAPSCVLVYRPDSHDYNIFFFCFTGFGSNNNLLLSTMIVGPVSQPHINNNNNNCRTLHITVTYLLQITILLLSWTLSANTRASAHACFARSSMYDELVLALCNFVRRYLVKVRIRISPS